MKRVLLICYYFPPLGMGGINRPLALFRGLPEQGWDCHVLTVKPVAYRAYEPELLEDLDQTKIFRSGSRDPQRIMYLLGVRELKGRTIDRAQVVSQRFFPDNKIGWVNPAVRKVEQLHSRYGYSAVMSTSPPVSAHLVAQRFVASTQLPWIADFRDYWGSFTLEEMGDEEFARKARAVLTEITCTADAVTTVNGSVADYLSGGEVVHTGYDRHLASLWRAPEPGHPFTIGLLGHYYTAEMLAPLWGVLDQVKRSSMPGAEQLRLVQVGETDRADLEQQLASHGLAGRCDVHGRLSRKATIEVLSAVSMFYLALPGSGTSDILPGRMFDLLASGRPVLAFVPHGSEVARLVIESQQGFCFQNDTVAAAADYVSNLLRRWESRTLVITPQPPAARPYGSDVMAEKFARLLDRLT
jgi:hypothetical protein